MAGTQIMRKDPPELSREALAEYYEETLEAFKAYGILPDVPLGSPPKMKLCIDCKWYKKTRNTSAYWNGLPEKLHSCMRPEISIVTGEKIPRCLDCNLERASIVIEGCGPNGKYWEAK